MNTTPQHPTGESDELRELVASTLWGKNYSELLKMERPAVDHLVVKLGANRKAYGDQRELDGRIDELVKFQDSLQHTLTDEQGKYIASRYAELTKQNGRK